MLRSVMIGRGVVLGLAVCLVLASGCSTTVTTVDEQISAEGKQMVRIDSDYGPVELYGLDCLDTVEVHAEYTFINASEESAIKKTDLMDLSLTTEGDEVVIELDIPHRAQPVIALLQVGIPAHLAGEIRTTDGAIRVEGLDADVFVETSNGQVDVMDVDGTAYLWTTNGAIVATNVNGDVRAETTNGKVSVEGGCGDSELATTNGEIAVSDRVGRVGFDTSNGAVNIEGLDGPVAGDTSNGAIYIGGQRGDVDVETTNGAIDIETTLMEGGSCSAETSNGRITLSVPDWTSATVDAQTSNGQIVVTDLLIDGEVSGSQLSGMIADGNGHIELRTTNGNLDISGRDCGGDEWPSIDECGSDSEE